MSHVYMAADLHLGHKNIHNFRTQFASAEEHDATVKENFESFLTKKDKLFLLGDIAFTRDALEWVKSLPCGKVLIGLHNKPRRSGQGRIVRAVKPPLVFSAESKV